MSTYKTGIAGDQKRGELAYNQDSKVDKLT